MDSIYSFAADNKVIAHLGPVSFAGVHHAGCNTEDYASDEVQDMAQQIASEHPSAHFGRFQID
jgi:hypothetical protein